MKIIKNLTLGIITISILNLNLLSITYAADKTSSTKPTTVVTAERIRSTSSLLKQTFQSGPLSVEFRYVKGTLQSLRLLNTGNYALDIHLLETAYILGPSDYVILNPPRLPYLMFSYEPYVGLKTVASRMFPIRFGDVHVYRLPMKR